VSEFAIGLMTDLSLREAVGANYSEGHAQKNWRARRTDLEVKQIAQHGTTLFSTVLFSVIIILPVTMPVVPSVIIWSCPVLVPVSFEQYLL
jgi:hypothetical protein